MTVLDTVESILGNLEGYLAKLSALAGYPKDDFLRDFTKVESAKHLLQMSIECCLDIAHHIIAEEGYRTAKDNYDAFVVLNEERILPDDFMAVLRQMVSFRNRVVHLYWNVDDAIVYDIVQRNLGDFTTFADHILRFVRKQAETE